MIKEAIITLADKLMPQPNVYELMTGRHLTREEVAQLAAALAINEPPEDAA